MTRLVILGGFLGAGKTTTLLRLARDLAHAGKRVGILANDQGQELVDTELFRRAGFETRDVRGGCFCCRLDDFVARAAALVAEHRPDVLLAEPVGSCTDLVATVLRPLRLHHGDRYEIAPFCVLADPHRLLAVLRPAGNAKLSEKITYIYRLQQLEADTIVVAKLDLLGTRERQEIDQLLATNFPRQRKMGMSSATGEGFDAFAERLLGPVARRLPRSPEVDYDRYAQGEAELAWFDARYDIALPEPVDIDTVLAALGAVLRVGLASAGDIAHVKVALSAGGYGATLSLVGDAEPQSSRCTGSPAAKLVLIANARVVTEPASLQAMVTGAVERWAACIGATATVRTQSSFRPGRPVPVLRLAPRRSRQSRSP